MDLADSMTIGSLQRSYRVHLPSTSAPMNGLLLLFHGGGATGRGMPILTHFDEIIDRERFVVVYPDGYRRHWTDSRGTNALEIEDVDDVGFVSSLIRKMITDYKLDEEHVYAAGISNGGFFSQRLAIEIPEQIRGIATVAATMPLPLSETQFLKKPISVMLIHGTDDPLVPFGGGHVRAGAKGPILSAHDSAIKWARLNGCVSEPEITYLQNRVDDSTRVRVEKYGSGKENTEVILYVIEGGGHTWPGGWQYFPVRIIGRTSHNLDASQEIMDFFKRH